MAQQKMIRAKMPDGSIQEFASVDDAKAAAAAMTAAPKADASPSMVQKVLGPFVGGAMESGYRALTNPENRSTMGAMATGPIGAKAGLALGGPPGALIGGLGGVALGGFLGSLSEGKTLGPAMQEGASELLLDAATGPIPNAAVTPVLKAGARRFSTFALNPTPDLIDMMRGPAGQSLLTRKEREREFRGRVGGLLDRVPGVPGNVRFGHGVNDLWTSARKEKVDALASSPIKISRSGLMAPDAWDDMLQRASRQRGGTAAFEDAPKAIDDTMHEWLSASEPVTTPTGQFVRRQGASGRPLMSPPQPRAEWTPTQIDQRLQGIQNELDTMLAARTPPGAPTDRSHPSLNEEALDILRRELSNTLSAQPIVGPSGRTIADMNRDIGRLLPVSGAAIDVPGASMGPPRIRFSQGNGGAPGLQAFEYIRTPAGMIGRSMNETANAVRAGSKTAPALQRLLRILMNPKEPE